MAIETYAESRDRGLAVRRYEFRYGPNTGNYFAYTDAPEQVVSPSNGRHRVYISIDRSKHMQADDRLKLAKDAAIYALERMQDDINANGTVYDVVISQFSWQEYRTAKFGVTVYDLSQMINWIKDIRTDESDVNYDAAIAHGVSWFGENAGANAVFRNWIMLTHGECKPDSIAPAKELAADLLSFKRSDQPGFISTDIYPVLIGSRDDRNILWFRNTPHFPIDVVEAGVSSQVWRRVGAVQRAAFQYDPLPITTSEIKTNGAPEEKNEVRITIPKNCGLANYYRDQRIQRPMQVAIFEGQADDPAGEFQLLWTGRVLSAKRMILQNTVELTAQPMTSAYKRSGLTRSYAYGCPHTLYGAQCGALKAAATRSFSPTATSWDKSNRVMDVPTTLFNGDAWKFAGGIVSWTEGGDVYRRNIIEAKWNKLLLDGPIDDAFKASNIYVSMGCDHTPNFCRNNHKDALTGQSNIVNYGGCDKTPTSNPFRTTSNFY